MLLTRLFAINPKSSQCQLSRVLSAREFPVVIDKIGFLVSMMPPLPKRIHMQSVHYFRPPDELKTHTKIASTLELCIQKQKGKDDFLLQNKSSLLGPRPLKFMPFGKLQRCKNRRDLITFEALPPLRRILKVAHSPLHK